MLRQGREALILRRADGLLCSVRDRDCARQLSKGEEPAVAAADSCIGGTRWAEPDGGWRTQIFSEILGLLSSLLDDVS